MPAPRTQRSAPPRWAPWRGAARSWPPAAAGLGRGRPAPSLGSDGSGGIKPGVQNRKVSPRKQRGLRSPGGPKRHPPKKSLRGFSCWSPRKIPTRKRVPNAKRMVFLLVSQKNINQERGYPQRNRNPIDVKGMKGTPADGFGDWKYILISGLHLDSTKSNLNPNQPKCPKISTRAATHKLQLIPPNPTYTQNPTSTQQPIQPTRETEIGRSEPQ